MATITLPKVLANFETSLAAKMSSSTTTFTLNSSVDGDGSSLSGVYELTVDEGASTEEHLYATLAGASGTVTRRGLSRVNGWTEVTGNKYQHERGASVKITNFSLILINRLLNGDDTFNSVAWTGVSSISGLSTPISSETTKAANVDFVLNTSYAGTVDGAEAVKGLFEAADSTEVAAGDDTGTTSAPTVVRPSKLAEIIQKGSYLYAVEDGTGSDDTYTWTTTPTTSAYTTGSIRLVKFTIANTGAATGNENSIGAKTFKKYVAGALADLETGDIVANWFGLVYYDGTYLVLLNPCAASLTTATLSSITTNWPTVTGGATSNADTLHTHNPSTQDAALFTGGSIHLPIVLQDGQLVYSGAPFGSNKLWKLPASIEFITGTSASGWLAVRTDGTDSVAASVGEDGMFGVTNGASAAVTLGTSWTACIAFRLGTVPASTDTFFIGFAEDADTLDASGASPTTSRHCGYQYNGTNWRITNGSNTTQTSTNVSTPAAGWHILKMVRITGTSLAFYLDGTLLGTHTTNLPTQGPLNFYMAHINNAASSKVIECNRFIDMYVATT